MNPQASTIFKRGSKTYYYSSLFFPNEVRQNIFNLYAFVRIADDFIDKPTPQSQKYYDLKKSYHQAITGALVQNEVAVNFASLVKKHHLNPDWVEAFFHSMEMDLAQTQYSSLKSVLAYIYGSAEVVGLMMAKILNLPETAYSSAQMLGRAMQFINFIRDIDEDLRLGRLYFPTDVLASHNLESLDYASIKKKPAAFIHFVRDQITLYRDWQNQAEAGYRYIPRRFLIPIKTAAEMYKWTARVIYEDPLIVYTKKVKPTRVQVVTRAFINTFTLQ